MMLEMQQIQIRNAALRFRFQSLSQKWTLMTTYWNRTLREIEAGTYRKDVAKVSRRLAQKGSPLTEQEAVALGIPASRARGRWWRARRPAAGGPGRRQRRRPQRPRNRRQRSLQRRRRQSPAPAHRRAAAIGRSRLLRGRTWPHCTAATTRRRAPPTARRPRWSSCATALAKHVPQMIAHLGTEKVEFDVVVKDGRAVLRPKK